MGTDVVSRIPYDNIVTEALVNGLPIVEYSNGNVTKRIRELWDLLAGALAA